MHQIQVESLTKQFRVYERAAGTWGAFKGLFHRQSHWVTAVSEISFSVDEGEIIGYIGPNGAGKSTTVKVLSGILVPDSGQVSVMGRTPWKKRIATVQRIGVVFGQRTQLWWDLPVMESFDLLKDIYRIPSPVYRRSRDELISRLRLNPFLDTPVRQLSLGQRMRCDLAAAMLHEPHILFLDEPTIGLDAVSKLAVREFIRELNRDRGVTVMLTTHDLDDIESLCRRVMVISEGRIVSDGTIQALRDAVSTERRLTVELRDSEPPDDPDLELLCREGTRYHFRFDAGTVTAPELIERINRQCTISDITVELPPIDEIIARMYGLLES